MDPEIDIMALQIGEFSWAEQFSPYINLMQSMVVTVKEKPNTSLPSIVATVSEQPRPGVVEGDFVVPAAKGVPLQPVNYPQLTEINQNSVGTKSLVFQHLSEYWPAYVIGGIVIYALIMRRREEDKYKYYPRYYY
jgi:hypothetical protein